MKKIKKNTKATPVSSIVPDNPIVSIPKKKHKKIKKKAPLSETIVEKHISPPVVQQQPVVTEPVVTEPVVITKVDTTEKIRPDTVSFYGHTIRNTFMNNQWYFSLEDILKVAKVIDPTKFLVELKNQNSLKEKYYSLVETFSYYEGDNPIIIPIVNFQNFMEILPTIRSLEYFMPGPFPDWLKNMANRKF